MANQCNCHTNTNELMITLKESTDDRIEQLSTDFANMHDIVIEETNKKIEFKKILFVLKLHR
jgi:hypothetical protein